MTVFTRFLLALALVSASACGDDDDPIATMDAGPRDGGGGGDCATRCASNLEFCDVPDDGYCDTVCGAALPDAQLTCFDGLRDNCAAIEGLASVGVLPCDTSACSPQCVNKLVSCMAPGDLSTEFCTRFCDTSPTDEQRTCLDGVDCELTPGWVLTEFLPCGATPEPMGCEEECQFKAATCFGPPEFSVPYCADLCSVATEEQLTCFEDIACPDLEPILMAGDYPCDIMPVETDGGTPDDGGVPDDGGMADGGPDAGTP